MVYLAHTVVCGPSTAPVGDGWSGNYFYNYALDGSGGREFLLMMLTLISLASQETL